MQNMGQNNQMGQNQQNQMQNNNMQGGFQGQGGRANAMYSGGDTPFMLVRDEDESFPSF